MWKHFFLIWMAFAILGEVQACDACGCSSSSSLMQIGSRTPRNFIGFRGYYLAYEATDHHGVMARDQFFQLDLRGQFFLGKRLKFFASLPLNYSRRYSEGSYQNLLGMGDAALIMDYDLIRQEDDSLRRWYHHLSVGAGIKAPTGDFRGNENSLPLPANFQLGTGSWDIPLLFHYSLDNKKWGASLDAAYRINTTNPEGYQFGNQLGISWYAFRRLPQEKVLYTPYLGTSSEWIQQDLKGGLIQEGTGGTGTFALIGLEVQWEHISLGANYRHPLVQDFGNGEVEARSRATIRLHYLF